MKVVEASAGLVLQIIRAIFQKQLHWEKFESW